MAYKIDVNVPKLVTVGMSSILIFAIVLLGAHGYFLKAEEDEFAIKHFDSVHPELTRLKAQYATHLNGYSRIVESPGTVQVPIDVAIEKMVATKGAPPATQPLGGG